jgi:transcriptional regulator with XRE-family HTH domain
MASHLGQQLRDERIRRHWTLTELAARAGISAAHLSQIEAGRPARLEAYARVTTSLDLRPELEAIDPRRRSSMARGDQDFVHAAMGELEATRLVGLGFEVALDEPYQHYQFAGRADVVAVARASRALLHLENRTRFPNIQDALGSFGAKRAYLGRVLAARFEIRGGWASETHVMVGLWTSEVVHAVRLRETTFRVTAPDPADRFRAWWNGDPSQLRGNTSSLVLFDPAPGVRNAFRLGEPGATTRPRYRGYAEAAETLREAAGTPGEAGARNRNARENPITRCSLSHASTRPDH